MLKIKGRHFGQQTILDLRSRGRARNLCSARGFKFDHCSQTQETSHTDSIKSIPLVHTKKILDVPPRASKRRHSRSKRRGKRAAMVLKMPSSGLMSKERAALCLCTILGPRGIPSPVMRRRNFLSQPRRKAQRRQT